MSSIGEKIKAVFGSVAMYKDPKNNEPFNGRSLPSFIKDYIVSMYIGPDGMLDSDALVHFLNEHIPSNFEAVKSRLMRGEQMTLLVRFQVQTNLHNNSYHFAIPDMGLNYGETEIPRYLVQQYPDDLVDGERWGIMKVIYMQPNEESSGHVEMIDFHPFRPIENMDLDYYRWCRSQFSTDEWIDVLISAMEYEPSAFASKTQKLEFLTRLLPFIEPRLNMVEFAHMGTGKSYVFGQLSKYAWLISGGKVSRAKLVYNKATQSPGIMRFYDLVSFDELQSITFSDAAEIQAFLKDYLEYGKATVDNYEFMSQCGLLLLGNIDLGVDGTPLNDNYFRKMPDIFHEAATLDRFHGMIEGWLLPRVDSSMFLHGWTLNTEFFSETLHRMRTEGQYGNVVNRLIEMPPKIDARHQKAIIRIATAYLKLLFPHITKAEDMNIEEFDCYCLQPAIRRRDIIRRQCEINDTGATYSKPIPHISVVSSVR